MNNNSYFPRCPDMDIQERSEVNNKTIYGGANKDDYVKGLRYNSQVPAIVISVCLFIILLTIFYLVWDEMPSICYIKILSPRLDVDSSDAQLKLFWINEHIGGICVSHFKIMCTHNNWRDTENIFVGKSESSCIVPNVLPEKLYRFTITSCLENSFEGEPSKEVTYNSGTPNPPNGLQAVVVNRKLQLVWTPPEVNIFIAKSYKISYTWNDWDDKCVRVVNTNELSCIISNILPEKTYKFKIASCLENSYESKPSVETLYYSESPNPPNGLQAIVVNRKLQLVWTPPEVILFIAKFYNISYTCNDWDDKDVITVTATESSCIIPNILPEKTYKFKIASCLEDSYQGKASVETQFYSESPKPPNGLQAVVVNRKLQLIWTPPEVILFIAKFYKILYTCNDWDNKDVIIVNATESSCIIPNILPEKTYKFKIASCLEDSYEGSPSVETLFYSKSPIPPSKLDTYIEDGMLLLTWSSPIQDLFEVAFFKILYTSNEWKDKEQFEVNANESSCKIQNVLPMKTYRFTIANCLTNFEGKPSSEHTFKSGRPHPPSSLEVIFESGNIKLVWTSPEETLFKTEEYHLEVSTDEWKSMELLHVHASVLECVINDFTLDATYRFKLCTVSHSEKSLPIQRVRIASPRYRGKVQLNGPDHEAILHDKTSSKYMAYKDGVEHGVDTAYKECTGNQLIDDLDFSSGSLFAVFILISQGCYDEVKLRHLLENAIKSGTFGYFKVSMEGFCFQALDNPVPPHIDHVDTLDEVISIFWSEPQKTFFKTTHYLLQTSTDNWSTYEEVLIPADQYKYCISNTVPSTKYEFQILSCARSGIKSLPSEKVYTVTKDIFREDEEAFFQQLWKLVHENVFSTVKHLFEKEYTHSEVEMFISRHRPSSFTSDKLIGGFQNIRDDMELLMAVFLGLKGCLSAIKYDLVLPEDSSIGLTSDLIRVEFYRRTLQNIHNGRISKEEFGKCLRALQDATTRLSVKHAFINKEDQDIDVTLQDVETTRVKSIQSLDSHQLIIEAWIEEDKRFQQTAVVNDILEALKTVHCITITGEAGVGKTLTMHHIALRLKDQFDYCIIPCTNTTDIKLFYQNGRDQIFVLDDICGKYTINHSILRDFIDNKTSFNLFMKKGKAKFITTCRTQVFQEKKFQKLKYLIGASFDLSLHYPLTIQERLAIAKEYLETTVVERIRYGMEHYSFFPLRCKLYSENPVPDAQTFFENPFDIYSKELNILYQAERREKYCALFLCVVFNGSINENLLSKDKLAIQNATSTKVQSVFTQFSIDSRFIVDSLDSFVGVYLKKVHSLYYAIHDKMFDFLCSFFGKKSQGKFIQFADVKILMNRTKLELVDATDNEPTEFTILILKHNETPCFERIVREIENGNIHHVFYSKQMEDKYFRVKFIHYLQTLSRTTITSLSCIKDKLKNFTGERQSINTSLSAATHLGHVDLVSFFLKHNDEMNSENLLFALQQACVSGYSAVVNLFVNKGTDLNKTSANNDWTPLMSACEKGHLNVIKLLVESKVNVNVSNRNGTTPLMVACSNKKTEAAYFLISVGAKVNAIDKFGCSSLLMACAVGSIEIVSFLISSGANINLKWNDSLTFVAEKLNSVVRSLLGEHVEQNCTENSGLTALHLSSQIGNIKIVKLLLEKGSNVDTVNKEGSTPLILACEKGHNEIVQLLLNANCDINKFTLKGRNALSMACENNNAAIVKILIENKAQINEPDIEGKMPLYYACQNGNSSVVNELLKKGSFVNVSDATGHNPAFIAAARGQADCLRNIILQGALINIPDKLGCTPLHKASFEGFDECVKLLLENNRWIDREDTKGWTSLMYCCQKGNAKTFKILAEFGANINYVSKSGSTPLTIACENNNVSLVGLLIKKGAKLDMCDINGVTPLAAASTNGHGKVIQLLLSQGADVDKSDFKGWTPLKIACSCGHYEVVKVLLQSGCNINLKGDDGWTPLHSAVKDGYVPLIDLLIQNNVNINEANREGWTPLKMASLFGNMKVVDILTQNGANINQTDNAGWTPLMTACQLKNIKVVAELICKGANVNQSSVNGTTPLMLACQNGNEKIVNNLITNYADIEKCDKKGQYPIKIACQYGHNMVLEVLIRNGASVNKSDNHGDSALKAAVKKNYLSIINTLINSKADVNIMDKNGNSPIFDACVSGNLEVVKLLIESGSNMSISNYEGWTPLMVAIQNRQSDIIGFLSRKGCKIYISSLFLACENGNVAMITFLISIGCQINIRNTDGLTPLMVACMHSKYKVVDYLMTKGALLSNDVHTLHMFLRKYDQQGNTILTKACQSGNDQLVQLLLDNGANPDLCDKNGWSPMTSACFGGHMSIVRFLISQGIDLTKEDGNNHTPLSVAINQNNIDCVELIIECCHSNLDLNAFDDKGLTPLMKVCGENGQSSLANILIANGADVNKSGINNLNPLEIACKTENLDCLDLLLASGAVLSEDSEIINIYKNNLNILQLACKTGYKHVLYAFLTSDYETDSMFGDDTSLLMLACHGGHDEVVDVLCKKGVNVNKKNNKGQFPLMIASNGKHISIINILVKQGANVDEYDQEGFTALMKACAKGGTPVIRTLLSLGADINLQINNNSPIGCACQAKDYEAVDYLLKVGINISKNTVWKCFLDEHEKHSQDLLAFSYRNGYEALAKNVIQGTSLTVLQCRKYMLLACKLGYETIVSLLVQNGANVNTIDANESSALSLACYGGYSAIVCMLIKARADLNKANHMGQTALHNACSGNHFDIIKVLLCNGVILNTADKKGETPLGIACKLGNVTIAELLIDNGAEIEATDHNGWNALLTGCYAGHENIVKILIQRGSPVNTVSKDGSTALQIVCRCGHTNITKYFIERGASVNNKNKNGRTPLQEACINNHDDIVEMLLLNGAEVNNRDNDGYTSFMSACKNINNKRIIEMLLRYGAYVNDLSVKGNYTPLRIACDNSNIETVEVLLQVNADASLADKFGVIPLHAVLNSYFASQCLDILECITQLMKNIQNVPLYLSSDFKIRNDDFMLNPLTDLQLGITDFSIVQLLSDHLSDIDQVTDQGQTALMIASKLGQANVVEMLIKKEANVNKRDIVGRTALSLACIYYHFQTVECLLAYGADINIADYNEETPLLLACNLDIFSVSASIKINHSEIVKNQLGVIQLLLTYNANVNKIRKDGLSSLMLACRWHSVDIVRCLIDKGADVLYKNNRSENSLFFACMIGNFEAVKILLENGADPFVINQDEVTVLKYTCDCMSCATRMHLENFYKIESILLPENVFEDPVMAYGPRIDFLSIIRTLIRYGVDINKADIHGWTPLMTVCKRGFLHTAEMLIIQGADVNVKSPDGLNALMLACIGGKVEIAKLLTAKSDINETSKNGWSSLKYACKHGHASIVEFLLLHYAIADQRDNEGWTPLMSACQGGHEDIVQLLLINKADANKYSFDRWHPLTLAKKGNFKRIERLLIDYGACINEDEDEEADD